MILLMPQKHYYSITHGAISSIIQTPKDLTTSLLHAHSVSCAAIFPLSAKYKKHYRRYKPTFTRMAHIAAGLLP